MKLTKALVATEGLSGRSSKQTAWGHESTRWRID